MATTTTNNTGEKIKTFFAYLFGREGTGTTIYIAFLVVYLYSDELGLDPKIVTVAFGVVVNVLINSKDANMKTLGEQLNRYKQALTLAMKGFSVEEIRAELDSPTVTTLVGKKVAVSAVPDPLPDTK